MCDKHCIVIMFCAIILSKYLDHHTIPLRMMATAIHNFILFHRLKCASISLKPIDIFHFLKSMPTPMPLFTAHLCYCRLKFKCPQDSSPEPLPLLLDCLHPQVCQAGIAVAAKEIGQGIFRKIDDTQYENN